MDEDTSTEPFLPKPATALVAGPTKAIDIWGRKLWVYPLVTLWLGLNVADAFYLYYYVEAVVNPTPRTAVNRNAAALNAYQAMVFFIGFPLSCVNLLLLGLVVVVVFQRSRQSTNRFRLLMWSALGVFVVVPIFLSMSFAPCFGVLVALPVAGKNYWDHRCDPYPLYAILDGPSYKKAGTVKSYIYVYETSTNRFLYTYELTNPANSNLFYLRLYDWAVDQATIPVDEYPTLQSIGYDYNKHILTGNCTLPATSSNQTVTSACVQGTFDPGNHLAFNITSAVPLNTTAPSSPPNATTTQLRIEDSAWTYRKSQYAPGLILHQIDNTTGVLGREVLRTALTAPRDCTELKVCLAGVPGREAGKVGAEVLAPLGVVLVEQARYAVYCTAPRGKR